MLEWSQVFNGAKKPTFNTKKELTDTEQKTRLIVNATGDMVTVNDNGEFYFDGRK